FILTSHYTLFPYTTLFRSSQSGLLLLVLAPSYIPPAVRETPTPFVLVVAGPTPVLRGGPSRSSCPRLRALRALRGSPSCSSCPPDRKSTRLNSSHVKNSYA